ncbi:MAG: hypothetical protein KDE59_23000 [Anaerolineales bacterium]|nr:hypothetical protein [Anaerolineales bacterium]MCB0007900.1 hypothetical protein [Anaerolineales bacterium]MCB0027959.1 hypothetical protein [Anaerolineales bacterium]
MNRQVPANRRRSLLILFLIILVMIIVVSVAAAGLLAVLLSDEGQANPFLAAKRYEEPFIETGRWGTGQQPGPDGTMATGSVGTVVNGVYELELLGANGLHWATAGEEFGDGRYELDVTFVDGPLDNAGGLVFMFDREAFYFFVVRGDGRALIARCSDGCGGEFAILAQGGWFQTEADWGVGSQNRLAVTASGGALSFYINGDLVATVNDDSLMSGDVGLIVSSGPEGQAHFAFDNILVAEE